MWTRRTGAGCGSSATTAAVSGRPLQPHNSHIGGRYGDGRDVVSEVQNASGTVERGSDRVTPTIVLLTAGEVMPCP